MKQCALALLCTAALNASAFSAPVTHCTLDEQVVFSCASGKKVISICAAPKGAVNDYVEYRFSSDHKPEFSYRAAQNLPLHRFNRANVAGASSASTVVWFENQGYFYVVSDPVKGMPALVVQKAKKVVSKMECTANMTIDLRMSNAYITEQSSAAYRDLLD